MKYSTRIGAFAWAVLLSFAPTFANASDDEETQSPAPEMSLQTLSEYSLDDLLGIVTPEATVTSKRAEKTVDAPGMVSVFTRQEFQKMNYYTVAELAGVTAGYHALPAADAELIIGTRGAGASLNEKHLLLIDGIAINHARNNKAIVWDELPLLFAQQVEFLRGPASALYGVGAFNGVVNIVPRQLTEAGTSVAAQVGARTGLYSNSLGKRFITGHRLMVDALHTTDNMAYHVGFGYHGNAPTRSLTGEDGSTNIFRDNRESLFGHFSGKLISGASRGLSIGAIYMSRDNGYGTSWAGASNRANSHRWVSFIPYVRYARNFGESVGVKSYVKYQSAREAGRQANNAGWWTLGDATRYGIFSFDVVTHQVESRLETSLQLSEEFSAILGAQYDLRFQDPTASWTLGSNDPEFGNLFDEMAHIYSAYAQFRGEFAVLEGLLATLGVRSDNGKLGEHTFHNLSPRVGLVQRVTDTINVKVLYGSALKAPGQDTYSHNIEKRPLLENFNQANGTNYVLAGLEAETMRSLELGASFTLPWLSIGINGFRNIINNELARAQSDAIWGTDAAGVNSDFWQNREGSITSVGGEFELRTTPMDHLWVMANASVARVRNQNNQVVDFVPTWMANASAHYTFSQLAESRWGVVLRWMGGYGHSLDENDAAYDQVVEDRKGYGLVDLTLGVPLPQDLELKLDVRNLLDSKLYTPDGVTPLGRRTVGVYLGSTL